MTESTWLGKTVPYPATYAPEMLVAVPRQLNRELIGLEENNLPFSGLDVWHAYEFSCLTEKGLPVVAVLKLSYPSNSPNLIESKSLKLYLNSFNMSRFGSNTLEAIQLVKKIIIKDLSHIAGKEVSLFFHLDDAHLQPSDDFSGFQVLENLPGMEHLSFTAYTETPTLLKAGPGGSLKACSRLLRSNCKITFQPDWGDIFIDMEGESLPELDSLLRYIVSFRDEKHFHEEICESVYYHLYQQFNPAKLMVTCVYTRRGGIDICPIRVNDASLIPKSLSNPTILADKLLRQ